MIPAGHRDDGAVGAPGVEDRDLLLGPGPGVDVDLLDPVDVLPAGDRVAVDDLGAGADDADLLGDRPGRGRVVTGDEHPPDPGGATGGDHLGDRDHPEARLGQGLGRRLRGPRDGVGGDEREHQRAARPR